MSIVDLQFSMINLAAAKDFVTVRLFRALLSSRRAKGFALKSLRAKVFAQRGVLCGREQRLAVATSFAATWLTIDGMIDGWYFSAQKIFRIPTTTQMNYTRTIPKNTKILKA